VNVFSSDGLWVRQPDPPFTAAETAVQGKEEQRPRRRNLSRIGDGRGRAILTKRSGSLDLCFAGMRPTRADDEESPQNERPAGTRANLTRRNLAQMKPKRRTPKKPSSDAHDAALRKHLIELLRSRGAHADFDAAVDGLPEGLRGARVKELPFTPWRLLEHLRLAQWDILEFSRNPKHESPQWPQGYWPAGDAPPNSAAWDASVTQFRRALTEMEKLVRDSSNDLFAPLPHGQGQTLLREALLVADHNSYHLGQLIMLRRLLGAWKEER